MPNTCHTFTPYCLLQIQGGDGERYVPIIQTGAPAITPTTEPLHSAEEPKATNETHIKIQQEGK